MARIVVLGGGKQGQTIAADLASRHEVTVADARPLHLAGVPLRWNEPEDLDTSHLTGLDHYGRSTSIPARSRSSGCRSAFRSGYHPVYHDDFYPATCQGSPGERHGLGRGHESGLSAM